MSLIPHATLPFLVHQTPQINRVSRSPRSVRPCQEMRQTVLPFLCTFPSATLNMRDRRLTFLSHLPLHPVFYTSSRSSSCQCCGAWCCNLVSRTFFRPHYHHYPTPGPTSPASFEHSALCKRGRTVHGSLPLAEPSVPDFLFDCCSCQHPRPCEHVRGARMRSNPVSTWVEPMKSVIH